MCAPRFIRFHVVIVAIRGFFCLLIYTSETFIYANQMKISTVASCTRFGFALRTCTIHIQVSGLRPVRYLFYLLLRFLLLLLRPPGSQWETATWSNYAVNAESWLKWHTKIKVIRCEPYVTFRLRAKSIASECRIMLISISLSCIILILRGKRLTMHFVLLLKYVNMRRLRESFRLKRLFSMQTILLQFSQCVWVRLHSDFIYLALWLVFMDWSLNAAKVLSD